MLYFNVFILRGENSVYLNNPFKFHSKISLKLFIKQGNVILTQLNGRVPEEAAVNLVKKDQDAEFELPAVNLNELPILYTKALVFHFHFNGIK